MAIYELNDCKICGRLRALKDGICIECNEIQEQSLSMPDFMQEFFNNPDSKVKK